jgi:Tfp pilus assembly protein PilF
MYSKKNLTKTRHFITRMQRSIAASVVVLSLVACASVKPSNEALSELCSATDFSNIKQRTLLAAGYKAIGKSDLACAERLTKEARKLDPKDAYAALNLGAIYQRTNRIELAKVEYQNAIALDTNTTANKDLSTEATASAGMSKSPGAIAKQNLLRIQK